MSINNKKAIVCDLDGTLAESKSAISEEMSGVLCGVLRNHYLAIVSGGTYNQFQKQFLANFTCPPEFLTNLYLFPTNGSVCYKYDAGASEWKQLYAEVLSQEQREKIINAINESINELGLNLAPSYGEIVEDRGSQVTFSGCGQEAPVSVKELWDPDQTKRREIKSVLERKIPEFEIRMGGMTSIDITRRGIDKAYAVDKIKAIMNVSDEDIIFVGDALYKGGNDSSVKKTEVDFIQKDGPGETIEFLRQFV
jgi:HAD superfamily hydrolase (TIGR01484 family)